MHALRVCQLLHYCGVEYPKSEFYLSGLVPFNKETLLMLQTNIQSTTIQRRDVTEREAVTLKIILLIKEMLEQQQVAQVSHSWKNVHNRLYKEDSQKELFQPFLVEMMMR